MAHTPQKEVETRCPTAGRLRPTPAGPRAQPRVPRVAAIAAPRRRSCLGLPATAHAAVAAIASAAASRGRRVVPARAVSRAIRARSERPACADARRLRRSGARRCVCRSCSPRGTRAARARYQARLLFGLEARRRRAVVGSRCSPTCSSSRARRACSSARSRERQWFWHELVHRDAPGAAPPAHADGAAARPRHGLAATPAAAADRLTAAAPFAARARSRPLQ